MALLLAANPVNWNAFYGFNDGGKTKSKNTQNINGKSYRVLHVHLAYPCSCIYYYTSAHAIPVYVYVEKARAIEREREQQHGS